jgi:hypothetical protein
VRQNEKEGKVKERNVQAVEKSTSLPDPRFGGD